MGKTELQRWILERPGFIKQYQRLLLESVSRQFLGIDPKHQYGSHDWGYLLMSGSLLAQSDEECCQDTALRIAQFCIESPDSNRLLRDAAAVILDTLANRPAICLAESRKLLGEHVEDRLPFPLFMDWTKRSIQFSVSLLDGRTLFVNRFQKRFWEIASRNDWLSISAPTSAGKSHIVEYWLIDYLRLHPLTTIVYLVPTRALIQQVEHDILALLTDEGVGNVAVVTLPMHSALASDKANLLVFTQERLHILLANSAPGFSINLLVVDEAQKIGDSYRGVLLQQAIEDAISRNPNCRVFFASPMTENPEALLEDAPTSVSTAKLLGEDITVNQNLLWVSQVHRHPKLWKVELILQDGPAELGEVELPSSPHPASKRLPYVAYALGDSGGGNVIYVNGAADAEKAAKQLYDLAGDTSDCSEDRDVRNLVDLIRKIVHPSYALARVLNRGVGFHYGNMPLLIRSEIEKLFKANKLRYLVCTSTLLEGVNLPCRSMFIRGPTKGRGTPMNLSDFWNLAGRAGRWGKEFQGNVVCVDARRDDIWKMGVPTRRERVRISRTSDEILNSSDDLLQFIRSRTPREEARKRPDLEYMFSYLVTSFIRSGGIESTQWSSRFPSSLISDLQGLLTDVVENLSTPTEVIFRNPGISSIAMDSLLDYFDSRTVERNEPVEGLIPVPAESDVAVDEYAKVLYRINRYLGKDAFGRGNRVRQLALLIVDWMRGYPLARMIASRERHYGANNLPALIRGTMSDVEEFARFQAPKFLTCYVDLLRVYLERIQRHDLTERLMDLNVLLEFGVSQTTQLSLMGLGLSRTSTVAISEYISNDSLDEGRCLAWLQENDWMTQDMPELVKREIGQVLRNHVESHRTG